MVEADAELRLEKTTDVLSPDGVLVAVPLLLSEVAMLAHVVRAEGVETLVDGSPAVAEPDVFKNPEVVARVEEIGPFPEVEPVVEPQVVADSFTDREEDSEDVRDPELAPRLAVPLLVVCWLDEPAGLARENELAVLEVAVLEVALLVEFPRDVGTGKMSVRLRGLPVGHRHHVPA